MVTCCLTCKVEIPTGRRYCSRTCHLKGFQAYNNAIFRANREARAYYQRHPWPFKTAGSLTAMVKAGKGGEGDTATSPST